MDRKPEMTLPCHFCALQFLERKSIKKNFTFALTCIAIPGFPHGDEFALLIEESYQLFADAGWKRFRSASAVFCVLSTNPKN
ncbi:MAG: hypothetical protein HDT14_12335 [Oscillibacter sp.]|nr:hypothetical protein [Oscillibacter sp.]